VIVPISFPLSPTGIKAHLALLLIGALPVAAAECFVATTGSNTASGTAEHPFRTIQKGIDAE
jgi:hypothetical protein